MFRTDFTCRTHHPFDEDCVLSLDVGLSFLIMEGITLFFLAGFGSSVEEGVFVWSVVVDHWLDLVESVEMSALCLLLSAFIDESIATYDIPHKL